MENQGSHHYLDFLKNTTLFHEKHISMPSSFSKNCDLMSSIGQVTGVYVCMERFLRWYHDTSRRREAKLYD